MCIVQHTIYYILYIINLMNELPAFSAGSARAFTHTDTVLTCVILSAPAHCFQIDYRSVSRGGRRRRRLRVRLYTARRGLAVVSSVYAISLQRRKAFCRSQRQGVAGVAIWGFIFITDAEFLLHNASHLHPSYTSICNLFASIRVWAERASSFQ